MYITIFSPTKRSILMNVAFFEYLAKDRSLTVQLEGGVSPSYTRNTILEPGDVVTVNLGPVCLDHFTAQPQPQPQPQPSNLSVVI
jgi:hypothetical protein